MASAMRYNIGVIPWEKKQKKMEKDGEKDGLRNSIRVVQLF